MNIEGTAAIVTGGASGLGAATARRLAAAGAHVTIFDAADDGATTARENGCDYQRVDITDEDAIASALLSAANKHGEARILVNCAGTGRPELTVDKAGQPHNIARFRRLIEINLVGQYIVISKFSARLATAPTDAEEHGVIINTASIAAFDGQAGQVAYAASKAAVAGMTLPLARDLASLKIRVMTIAPGFFPTPLVAQTLSDRAIASLQQQTLFPKRGGDPTEFAALAVAIVENAMLNAEVVRLDAGMRMALR